MSKVEIEYKFELKNVDAVTEFLDKNAEYKYENHQIDTYYDSELTGYSKDIENGRRIDEWLRVREEGNKASINFKDYGISDNKGYCTEHESIIESPDDVKKIIESMKFEPIAIVDKIRRAYNYKDVEISIDTVKGLGCYIELEYYGDSQDIEAVQKSLMSMVDEIGAKTGPADERGYPYHLIVATR